MVYIIWCQEPAFMDFTMLNVITVSATCSNFLTSVFFILFLFKICCELSLIGCSFWTYIPALNWGSLCFEGSCVPSPCSLLVNQPESALSQTSAQRVGSVCHPAKESALVSPGLSWLWHKPLLIQVPPKHRGVAVCAWMARSDCASLLRVVLALRSVLACALVLIAYIYHSHLFFPQSFLFSIFVSSNPAPNH